MVKDLTSPGKQTVTSDPHHDFQDLESIAKRKLKNLEELQENISEAAVKLVSMEHFEKKWFGFQWL